MIVGDLGSDASDAPAPPPARRRRRGPGPVRPDIGPAAVFLIIVAGAAFSARHYDFGQRELEAGGLSLDHVLDLAASVEDPPQPKLLGAITGNWHLHRGAPPLGSQVAILTRKLRNVLGFLSYEISDLEGPVRFLLNDPLPLGAVRLPWEIRQMASECVGQEGDHYCTFAEWERGFSDHVTV